MLKKIVLGLVVLGLVLLPVVAMQPSAWHVERSANIAAPVSAVYPLVNDLHAWQRWSPWEDRDPNLVREYRGEEAGPGAVYAWSGNDDVGEGRMTITDSVPEEHVALELAFLRPMEATNQARFTFQPTADGTLVTWSMDGERGFVEKAFALVFDVDALVGHDFETGLASLKAEAEGEGDAGSPGS